MTHTQMHTHNSWYKCNLAWRIPTEDHLCVKKLSMCTQNLLAYLVWITGRQEGGTHKMEGINCSKPCHNLVKSAASTSGFITILSPFLQVWIFLTYHHTITCLHNCTTNHMMPTNCFLHMQAKQVSVVKKHALHLINPGSQENMGLLYYNQVT